MNTLIIHDKMPYLEVVTFSVINIFIDDTTIYSNAKKVCLDSNQLYDLYVPVVPY